MCSWTTYFFLSFISTILPSWIRMAWLHNWQVQTRRDVHDKVSHNTEIVWDSYVMYPCCTHQQDISPFFKRLCKSILNLSLQDMKECVYLSVNECQIDLFINRNIDWKYTIWLKMREPTEIYTWARAGTDYTRLTQRMDASHKTFGVGWVNVSWALLIKVLCSVAHRTTHMSSRCYENHEKRRLVWNNNNEFINNNNNNLIIKFNKSEHKVEVRCC